MTVLALGSLADAKSPQDVKITKVDNAAVMKSLENGKLKVLGKQWDAAKFCNEDTTSNPDTVEVYSLKGQGFETVVLCPGTLDGVENVVTVFSKTEKPKTKKVAPLESSSRITDDVLKKTIEELIKK